MDNNRFKDFIDTKFIPFMQENEMVEGTISNGLKYKAYVKKDKHGFYRVKITEESTSRGIKDE